MTTLATPGVYIVEKNAFSSSAIPVATAVPAFIGFTAKAMKNNKSLYNKPVRLTSMEEYIQRFGTASKPTFAIADDPETGFTLTPDDGTTFYLFNSMRYFFTNGGTDCWVVSVGNYAGDAPAPPESGPPSKAEMLIGGITPLLKELEPTMLVIPDAMTLPEADCTKVQQAMLLHCGVTMKNRFAILDVYDGFKARSGDEEDVVNKFRTNIGMTALQWGAAYYPWLNTSIVSSNEVSFPNISNLDGLQELLKKETELNLAAQAIDEERAGQINAEVDRIAAGMAPGDITLLANTLLAVSPLFKASMRSLSEKVNLLPASGAMAGLYCLVDAMIGVHKAPANISVGATIGPAVNITAKEQEDLNLPLNGKAINAIRTFPGKGVLVWGARTLDGNSQDWRYINVRRTMIMIEQSIKLAAEPYVFEPNVSTTWSALNATISQFLTNVWKSGALAGSSPGEAFEVYVGMGATMTGLDILEGIMRITVKVAITRPAEFIVITFQQKMQES